MIGKEWLSVNVIGSSMFRVSYKQKMLKRVIRDYSSKNFSDLEKRVAEKHVDLLHIQAQLMFSPSTELAEMEKEAFRKWSILHSAESSFLRQKSHLQWLREGDAGTAFYHRFAASRKSVNYVHFLIDDNGHRIETTENIQRSCVNYFKELLRDLSSGEGFEQSDISALLRFRCSQAQKHLLSKPFTSLEIKEVFFKLPLNKTSGPDGYTVEFYRDCWSMIGHEVVDAVHEFFKSGKLLKQWNSTMLVLIPKSTNACSLRDFRPISCLNTLYKVISRLLADRLKLVISTFINPAQSAFIPGRLLAENVLLATEIVKGYNRRHITPRGMLKVDLRKAFDSVNWNFIIGVLQAIDIPPVFVNWISQCITTPTFSVLVNGALCGFFKSSRGLRQGDPLSPYLFVLAMEVFSSLIHSRFQNGYIGYHPKTESLHISHLMFADDVMVFFDGKGSSLHGIYETLEDFASWSGLSMNRQKTELFTAGLNAAQSLQIARYGFPLASLPIRYLGLPLMHRKLKISEFEPLILSLTRVFSGWANKCLSYAGRVQLISSVVSGITNFWLSTFRIPQGCIRKIEGMCSRFLWTGKINNRSSVKISWKKVCLPKEEGGLGLRRLGIWNRTLALRHIWSLFSGKETLWLAWHKKHSLQGRSFWSLTPSPRDSWNWKALLSLRDTAAKFVKGILRNGSVLSFWMDSWTSLGPLLNVTNSEGPAMLNIPLNANVASVVRGSYWNLPHPRSEASLQIHTALTTILPPLPSDENDRYIWSIKGKDCCGYSSKLSWEECRPRGEVQKVFSAIWFKGRVPKHAFHMWATHLNRIHTKARLVAMGMNITKLCLFCNSEDETRDHLFLRCPYTMNIWSRIITRLGHTGVPPSWNDLLAWIEGSCRNAPSTLRKIVAQSILYQIWRVRNEAFHNHKLMDSDTTFQQIYKDVRLILSSRRHKSKFKNLMLKWI